MSTADELLAAVAALEGLPDRSFDVLVAVAFERARQEARKAEGRFTHTCADTEGINDYERFAILSEEVGEVAREVLTGEGRRMARDTVGTDEKLREELVQVAAVAVAWVEAIDAR